MSTESFPRSPRLPDNVANPFFNDASGQKGIHYEALINQTRPLPGGLPDYQVDRSHARSLLSPARSEHSARARTPSPAPALTTFFPDSTRPILKRYKIPGLKIVTPDGSPRGRSRTVVDHRYSSSQIGMFRSLSSTRDMPQLDARSLDKLRETDKTTSSKDTSSFIGSRYPVLGMANTSKTAETQAFVSSEGGAVGKVVGGGPRNTEEENSSRVVQAGDQMLTKKDMNQTQQHNSSNLMDDSIGPLPFPHVGFPKDARLPPEIVRASLGNRGQGAPLSEEAAFGYRKNFLSEEASELHRQEKQEPEKSPNVGEIGQENLELVDNRDIKERTTEGSVASEGLETLDNGPRLETLEPENINSAMSNCVHSTGNIVMPLLPGSKLQGVPTHFPASPKLPPKPGPVIDWNRVPIVAPNFSPRSLSQIEKLNSPASVARRETEAAMETLVTQGQLKETWTFVPGGIGSTTPGVGNVAGAMLSLCSSRAGVSSTTADSALGVPPSQTLPRETVSVPQHQAPPIFLPSKLSMALGRPNVAKKGPLDLSTPRQTPQERRREVAYLEPTASGDALKSVFTPRKNFSAEEIAARCFGSFIASENEPAISRSPPKTRLLNMNLLQPEGFAEQTTQNVADEDLRAKHDSLKTEIQLLQQRLELLESNRNQERSFNPPSRGLSFPTTTGRIKRKTNVTNREPSPTTSDKGLSSDFSATNLVGPSPRSRTTTVVVRRRKLSVDIGRRTKKPLSSSSGVNSAKRAVAGTGGVKSTTSTGEDAVGGSNSNNKDKKVGAGRKSSKNLKKLQEAKRTGLQEAKSLARATSRAGSLARGSTTRSEPKGPIPTPDEEIQKFVNGHPDFPMQITKVSRDSYVFGRGTRTKVVVQLRGGNHVKVGSGYEPLSKYMETLSRRQVVSM